MSGEREEQIYLFSFFVEIWTCVTADRHAALTAILLCAAGYCIKALLTVVLKLGLQV